MRSPWLVGSFVVAAMITLSPAIALAQEAPASLPDRTSVDVPAETGPAGAVGLCGNPLGSVAGAEGTPGAPVDNPLGASPMHNGAVPDVPVLPNVSEVTGTVLHGEGTLLLVQQQALPDAGGMNPGQSASATQAVVQLPHNCAAASFSPGQQITVVGIPMQDGILDAETVQPE